MPRRRSGWNTVFRSGVPVAFIDWDTAAPGRALGTSDSPRGVGCRFFVTRSVEQSDSRPASWKLAADGAAWEVELAHRGLLDEGALEIAWVEQHAEALVES